MMPLLAGQEHPIREARRSVTRNGKQTYAIFDQSIITAAIYSNGTTTGDAALLDGLMLRRRNMLHCVEVALDLLADAGKHNVPRDQLIRLFRRLADSMNRSYLLPEQQVGRSIYQSLVEKMLTLPPPELGSPFPPTTFVAQETVLLNQQRVRLLELQPSLVIQTQR